MSRRAALTLAAPIGTLIATCGSGLFGCLPGDPRPPPARVYVTAEATTATREGFITSDGWAITFDRVAAGIGNVDLDGESCDDYNRANYQWLIDFVKAGEEKVGVVYGLGTCTLKFQLRTPSSDRTVFGAGATDALFATMRDIESDFWVVGQRPAVLVSGRAERAGVTKRFDWAFREGYELYECPRLDGVGNRDVLALGGPSQVSRKVEIRAEELFRLLPDDDAPLVFDPYAEADCDDDGLITTNELATVALKDVSGAGGADPSDPPPGIGGLTVCGQVDDRNDFDTLGDRVYLELAPRIARLSGGSSCHFDSASEYDD